MFESEEDKVKALEAAGTAAGKAWKLAKAAKAAKEKEALRQSETKLREVPPAKGVKSKSLLSNTATARNAGKAVKAVGKAPGKAAMVEKWKGDRGVRNRSTDAGVVVPMAATRPPVMVQPQPPVTLPCSTVPPNATNTTAMQETFSRSPSASVGKKPLTTATAAKVGRAPPDLGVHCACLCVVWVKCIRARRPSKLQNCC